MRIWDSEEILAGYKREGIDPLPITGTQIRENMAHVLMEDMAWAWNDLDLDSE